MQTLWFAVAVYFIAPVFSWAMPSSQWCTRLLSSPTSELRQVFFEEALVGKNRARFSLKKGEERFIKPLVDAINANDWTAKILNPEFARANGVMRAAVAAYRRGFIGIETVATLALRWSAARDFSKTIRLKTLPLLSPEGTLTPHAVEFFADQKMEYARPAIPKNLTQIGLPSRLLPQLQEALSRLPASERNLFVIDTVWNKEPWECSVICNSHIWRMMMPRGLATFGQPNGVGYILVIPSFSVLQTYLNVRYGDDAVQLFPRIGSASFDKVYFSIAAGGRVFGLNFPGLKPMIRVDRVELGQLFFTWHDDYHAYLASSFPRQYREILPRLLMVLKESQKAAKMSRKRVRKLAHKILDFELPSIRNSLADRSIAALIKTDFTVEEIAVIRRDLEANSGLYEAAGLNVPDLLQQLSQ